MTDLPLAPVPDFIDTDDWHAVCGEARDRCGWHIAPLVTETMSGHLDPTTGRLVLPTLALEEIVSVTDPDGVAMDVAAWDLLPWGVVYPTSLSSGPLLRRNARYVFSVKHGHRSCPDALLGVLRARAQRSALAGAGAKRLGAGPFSAELGVTEQELQREERVIEHYTLPGKA